MSIALTHQGLPPKVSQLQLVKIVKGLAQGHDDRFRLSRTAVAVLEYLVFGCRKSDFEEGRICGCWEQPETIARELGISTKVLHNAEAELRKVGYIERTYTAHARRRGERRNGKIVSLAGISLRPLIDKCKVLLARLVEMAAAKEIVADRHSRIHELRWQIFQSGQEELCQTVDEVVPGGRISKIRSIERLDLIVAKLEAIQDRTEVPTGETDSCVETEEIVSPLILESNFKKNRNEVGRKATSANEIDQISPERAIKLASADYQALRQGSGRVRWSDIVEFSNVVRGWYQISQESWAQACELMTRERAALSVLILDQSVRLPKKHPYRRESFRGSFEGVIAKEEKSAFNILGMLKAMAGYQEGECGSVVPPTQKVAWQLPLGVKRVGSALPDFLSVRRQNIWHNSRRRLAECGLRLGLGFRRRACGVASAEARWSVA